MRFLPRLLLAGLLAMSSAAVAQPAAPEPPSATASSPEQREAELQAAWKAAASVAVHGPAAVPLNNEAKLAVPAGMVFVPQAEAIRLSRALGNRPGPDLSGIVTTLDADDEWMVLVRWTADGYIRDDEAADLDADKIMDSLREGTEDANQDRLSRGFPELDLLGWTQPPHYDASTHRLSWAMRVNTKGSAPEDASINFNTRALGRDGYFSLNLITGQDRIEKDQAVSATLLSSLEYDSGKRYQDFNASTDHVAEYGLAALIGVVVAKKLGFLALASVFVLKFAKLGLVAVAGVGLAIKRFFRKKPGA